MFHVCNWEVKHSIRDFMKFNIVIVYFSIPSCFIASHSSFLLDLAWSCSSTDDLEREWLVPTGGGVGTERSWKVDHPQVPVHRLPRLLRLLRVACVHSFVHFVLYVLNLNGILLTSQTRLESRATARSTEFTTTSFRRVNFEKWSDAASSSNTPPSLETFTERGLLFLLCSLLSS